MIMKTHLIFIGLISLLSCGPSEEEKAKAKAVKHTKDSIESIIIAERIKTIKDSIEMHEKYLKERTAEEYTSILCAGHWGFDINDDNNGVKFANVGKFVRRESLAEGSLCVYRGSWSLGEFDSLHYSKMIIVITEGMNYSDYDKFDTAYWYLILTPDNTLLTCPSGRTMNNYAD